MRAPYRILLLTLAAVFAVQERLAPARPIAFVPTAQLSSAGGADSGKIIIPVAGIEASALRDGFLSQRGTRVHHAIDIPAPRDTPALAAVDGRIVKLYQSDAGGLTIYLADTDEHLVYYYAHLDHYASGLAEGTAVHRGEVIGYVGTTGNATPDFPHLHFAIEEVSSARQWSRGVPVNPYPILMARGITAQIPN